MTKKIEVTELTKQITVNAETKVVSIVTPGPAGAKGIELDDTNRVDGSVPVFRQSLQKYVADQTTATTELTDGGNFWQPLLSLVFEVNYAKHFKA